MSERTEPRLTIPDVIDRFTAYFRLNPTWGLLHVVLDDSNHQDSMVRSIVEQPFDPHDDDDTSEGRALAEILLRLTRTQRGKLDQMCRDRVSQRKG